VVGAGWLPTALSEGGSGVAGRAMVVRLGGGVPGRELWDGREDSAAGFPGGVQGRGINGIE
jgi:hypothetical protein